MLHTTTSASESASTVGSVWTTVEGKLTIVRADRPTAGNDLQRQRRSDHLDPHAFDEVELPVGFLTVREVAVRLITPDQVLDSTEVRLGFHEAGLNQRCADQISARLQLGGRVPGAYPGEIVWDGADPRNLHRHAGEKSEPAP